MLLICEREEENNQGMNRLEKKSGTIMMKRMTKILSSIGGKVGELGKSQIGKIITLQASR